jgi:predicted PurR-regulated permease PerM
MSFEDEYVRRLEKKNPLNPFLPVLGLFLAAALGAVAYIVSEPLQDLLSRNIANFPAGTEIRYVIAGVLFIILLLFAGMIYALLAPKPTKLISEQQLKKERVQREQDRLAKKRRKQRANIQRAKEARDSDRR